jgi:hypothetical protein
MKKSFSFVFVVLMLAGMASSAHAQCPEGATVENCRPRLTAAPGDAAYDQRCDVRMPVGITNRDINEIRQNCPTQPGH